MRPSDTKDRPIAGWTECSTAVAGCGRDIRPGGQHHLHPGPLISRHAQQLQLPARQPRANSSSLIFHICLPQHSRIHTVALLSIFHNALPKLSLARLSEALFYNFFHRSLLKAFSIALCYISSIFLPQLFSTYLTEKSFIHHGLSLIAFYHGSLLFIFSGSLLCISIALFYRSTCSILYCFLPWLSTRDLPVVFFFDFFYSLHLQICDSYHLCAIYNSLL